MRRTLLALLSLALGGAAFAFVPPTSATTAPYTVQTLHFKVQVGPGGTRTCDIVGDLYTPADATSAHRVPAILTTNGFGGSKDDQTGIGKAFAQRGYAVLSYSGLGFGGSTCQITLDDPDFDGVAGSQLVSYLGGASGIAFTDAAHTQPAPLLNVITRDNVAHNGKHLANDPRVGMVGGSYGGQIQYAVASVDPRVDTIVPIITWNDLTYSLDPNNTAQTTGVSTSTPGATKLTWGLLFSGVGVLDGVQDAQGDPSRLLPCPNFATFVCPALATAAATGFFQNDAITSLRHASVASYMSKIKIPTLLMQGENDTLFNLNEAAATYQALKAQGTPVKMIWQSWGHSDATPAPGEIDLSNPDPATQYETSRASDWFDHYLKGSSVSTGPNFSYFRDWVDYTGKATPAFGTSNSFPAGQTSRYYLSGNQLVTSASGLAAGQQTLLTTAAGVPLSLNPLDALGSYANVPLPEMDAPGTAVQWNTSPLSANVDVVGSPKLTLKVSAPAAQLSQLAGPAGQLVVFVRIQDVAPDGTASDIRNLTAPVRVPNVSNPFTVTLPGFVHRFAPGHQIRLVVSGSSLNYRAGLAPNPVTITTGSPGQLLTLPVVG